MVGRSKKIKTNRRIPPPKIRAVRLTEEEKKHNDRRRKAEQHIRYLHRGYRPYNVYLPDRIRKKIQVKIREMIKEYEDGNR